MRSQAQQTIAELQKRIRSCALASGSKTAAVRSTGWQAIDELFPGQGIREGTLVEWLGDGIASGAAMLSLLVGRKICPAERPVVVIEARRSLFPLTLKALGFDLSQTVMAYPASEVEALWACEQALRCAGIGLVWMRSSHLSNLGFRRLQLAAEVSRGIGFLLRSAKAAHQPSWADVRLLVRPRPSRAALPRFFLEVADSHGRSRRSQVDIMFDNSKGTIHEVSSCEANPLSVVS
jgi:protein ImuA